MFYKYVVKLVHQASGGIFFSGVESQKCFGMKKENHCCPQNICEKNIREPLKISEYNLWPSKISGIRPLLISWLFPVPDQPYISEKLDLRSLRIFPS